MTFQHHGIEKFKRRIEVMRESLTSEIVAKQQATAIFHYLQSGDERHLRVAKVTLKDGKFYAADGKEVQ